MQSIISTSISLYDDAVSRLSDNSSMVFIDFGHVRIHIHVHSESATDSLIEALKSARDVVASRRGRQVEAVND